MIALQFVSQAQQDDCAKAYGVYEGEATTCPELLLEIFKKKQLQLAVEAFVYESSHLRRSIAVRLGTREYASRQSREAAGADLYKKFCEGDEKIMALDIRGMELDGFDLLVGILLSGWRFEKYRTKNKSEKKSVYVICEDPLQAEHNFTRHRSVIEGVLYARALTSEPPNVLFPRAYADKMLELEELGIKVEILSETALHELGMNALLAVGRGSSHESAVVVMTWNGLQMPSSPCVIVGKGVCFDSGGLCLKPKSDQHDMRWDKAGASVVAGLMKTLAIQKAPCHVVGIIGLVENMPDGNALRPSDVITTMSGQTIEITDTDSEGRLVLADCLWYAQQSFYPEVMIDLGTLTLDTVACLGTTYAGLFANSPALATELKGAGITSGDLVWELPMGEPFAKQLESSVADMKNEGIVLGGENAAAAELLKNFVNDVPWAHLDIAGVSWCKENLPLAEKGVTGFGVRLLEEWLHQRS